MQLRWDPPFHRRLSLASPTPEEGRGGRRLKQPPHKNSLRSGAHLLSERGCSHIFTLMLGARAEQRGGAAARLPGRTWNALMASSRRVLYRPAHRKKRRAIMKKPKLCRHTLKALGEAENEGAGGSRNSLLCNQRTRGGST